VKRPASVSKWTAFVGVGVLVLTLIVIAVDEPTRATSFDQRRDRSELTAGAAFEQTVEATTSGNAVQPFASQACDPNKARITGSVTVGDRSKPTGSMVNVWHSEPGSDKYWWSLGMFAWGNVTVAPVYDGDGAFKVFGNGPYKSPPGSGSYRCQQDAQGCRFCTGSFDIKLYAIFGNIAGAVTLLPEGTPVSNVLVSASPSYGAYTKADGSFLFPSRNGHAYWSLALNGDGTVPLSATFQLGVSGAPPEYYISATTYSSQIVNVSLFKPSPYMEETALRHDMLPLPLENPCESCLIEDISVNVLSGNMYFDQTDVGSLTFDSNAGFTRSYNSQLAHRKAGGGFGPGWSHIYEQQLSFPSASVIMLRLGDGAPIYFQDMDTDLIYAASVPFNRQSWIEKQPDGTFIRHLRQGGHETYDSTGRMTDMVDASGNITALGWNETGQLTSVHLPDATSLRLTYNALNRITTLSGPAGLIAAYAYDEFNRLQRVTYASGAGYTFRYDKDDQLLAVADSSGNALRRYTYAGNKAVTMEIVANRERRTFSYGAFASTVTDDSGNVTTYDWLNIWGTKRITKITEPCAECSDGKRMHSWVYDDKGSAMNYMDDDGNEWEVS
jgi:YD repeat-containing protein